jgi:hypothetical protein
MNPTPSSDLLDALAQHGWRLDKQREQAQWRCMYFCVPCGLWRCAVESGAWFSTPHEAIQAALVAHEAEERPEGRDGQAGLPNTKLDDAKHSF